MRLLLLAFCLIFFGCSSGSGSSARAPATPFVNANVLTFSATGQALQLNSFTSPSPYFDTVIFYPFTLATAMTIQILSSQYWYDCTPPATGRCSAAVTYDILDGAKNSLHANISANTGYSLAAGTYILRASLSGNGANSDLEFSVWRGGSEKVAAVMTCQSGTNTVSVSSQSITIKSSSGTSTLIDSATGCGQQVSGFQYFDFLGIGPSGSLAGTDLWVTNLKSFKDTSAIIYEAQITAGSVAGQSTLTCYSTDVNDQNKKILDQMTLENCSPSVSLQ